MQLRPARVADLPGIQQLLVEAKLPTVGITRLVSDFVVAEDSGKLLGAAAIEPCKGQHGLLRSVVVAPGRQHSGIGGQLVGRVIADAKKRGVKSLYLLTTTAERYFPRFGFVAVPRESVPEGVQATDEFREACPASATVMTLPLT
jgi:N-acetylglutamate synthase-like GNAT family acetyltransferase